MKVTAKHMKKISLVHIKINLSIQALGLALIMLAYTFASLVRFDNNVDGSIDGWMTAWKVLAPNGEKYWYWQFNFNPSVTCESAQITDEHVCTVVQRSWFSNNLLNVSLLLGCILSCFGVTWTFWQLYGYFHKMNVSVNGCVYLTRILYAFSRTSFC